MHTYNMHNIIVSKGGGWSLLIGHVLNPFTDYNIIFDIVFILKSNACTILLIADEVSWTETFNFM